MQFPDIVADLRRQIDRKDRSHALFAFDLHGAAMALHQMFDNGKAKACAADSP